MAGQMKLVLGFLALLPFFAASAEDSGNSVVLVYNRRMFESKQVADHYAEKRHVPKDHILALDLPETESISRDDFEAKLQQPLWNALKSRNLFVYPEPISVSSTSRCSMVQ